MRAPGRRSWDLFDVEAHLDVLSRERLVFVPAQLALVFDGRNWSILPAPPQWWLDEQDDIHERDLQPAGALTLVPPWRARMTACRPGRGLCRRRHAHASQRRSQPQARSA